MISHGALLLSPFYVLACPASAQVNKTIDMQLVALLLPFAAGIVVHPAPAQSDVAELFDDFISRHPDRTRNENPSIKMPRFLALPGFDLLGNHFVFFLRGTEGTMRLLVLHWVHQLYIANADVKLFVNQQSFGFDLAQKLVDTLRKGSEEYEKRMDIFSQRLKKAELLNSQPGETTPSDSHSEGA